MNINNMDQMINCSLCPNMCRFDCPAAAALKRESATPAGRMRLAVMLERGEIEASPEIYQHLFQCLGCKNCEVWCPFAGLSVSELLYPYRMRAAAQGMAPQAVYELNEKLKEHRALFPQLEMLPLTASPGSDVLLFAGCTYRARRPAAVQAAFNIIKSAGINVTMLPGETCCGFPAGCLGFTETSRSLAEQTRTSIIESGARTLVTMCPECLAAFTRKYSEIGLGLDIEVLHFTQYVLRLIEAHSLDPQELDLSVVYHDPCVLGRGLEIYDEPRQVLAAIPGLNCQEARFNRDKAHCCGAGQLFEQCFPGAAREIAGRRSRELEESNARAIVTSCPFCEDMLSRTSRIPVYDISELLWAALDPGARKDLIIHEQACLALNNSSDLKGLDIGVAVENGIVTLRGQVDSWEQVVSAGHLVGSLPGIISVVNNLEVPGLKRTWTPADLPGASGVEHEPADVVIIGAGVIGCAIARELSRYRLNVVLLEKEADVCCGTSKANNGMIHPGLLVTPGTLKARLNVRGAELYPEIARELDFPYNRCGLLGLVKNESEMFLLDLLKAQAEANGVPGFEILRSREEVLLKEPNVDDNVIGGFFCPTAAMTSPYQVTIAYAENAVQNGVRLHLETTVTALKLEANRVTGVVTDKGFFPARYVINAAGLYADIIAAMAGPPEFTIHPRKGELVILDNKYRNSFRPCMAEVTLQLDPYTKGGGIMMTVDGNVELGPTAVEVPDREDLSTSSEGLQRVIKKFEGLARGVDTKAVIAYFAGLRAATYTEDFHIRPSRWYHNMVNVAGIQSPGLASAPAIAEYVLNILKEEGLEFIPRDDFNPYRKEMRHFRDLPLDARQELIRQDRRYGRIVCRCEQVTEGEIVEAINRPVPATTLDGIKRRTRAGMGRCQGSFCTPRVVHILARELGIPVEKVTKDGAGSWLFAGQTKIGGI